ncbi:MAG: HAMP domain-containing sensor histidine kinase [Actinomycetota bacterium]
MKWRLLAAFVGVTIMVLAAHDIPLSSYIRGVERDRLLASLERDAFVIGGSGEDFLSGRYSSADGDKAGSAAQLQATADLYRARDGAQVVVTDSNGVAVAVSDDSSRVGVDYSNRPEIASAIAGNPITGERHSTTLGADIVYAAVPVRSGPDVVGAVRITYPAAVVSSRASSKVRGLVLVALISLAGAAVAALLLAASITSPLARLQRTTERVASGDLSSRADNDEGPPEVRQLADSFNTMTGRVNELIDEQKAFAGDASHQLRTPLTALRLQLERAGDLVDTDPTTARERIEAATAETERLQRLVEGLLMLARADRADVAVEPIDVRAVVDERVEMWAPLAAERGIDLTATPTPAGPLWAKSVPNGFEQIIDNLLDNAISIVPDNSAIDLAIDLHDDAHGSWVTVHVLDRGPGMSDEQLADALHRFWRAPDAPHEGSGLGLAIADHLARASGGSLALAHRPGGGLDAAIHLSRA